MNDKTPSWWQAAFILPNGGPSYSEIWAADREEAERIAALRGFGKVRKLSNPPKEFRPSRQATWEGGLSRPDVLHSLCYLSFLAARSGVATAEQLVGDDSPLHELAHYLGAGDNIRGGNFRTYVIERLRWLESIIPGMPPNDVVLEHPEPWRHASLNENVRPTDRALSAKELNHSVLSTWFDRRPGDLSTRERGTVR